MRETDPPAYHPPAPGETLRQWLTSTSEDWLEAQPTMWMPAVPADPATPAPPAIPRQRGSERAARRRAVNGFAAHGPAPLSEGARRPDRSLTAPVDVGTVRRPRSVWTALVGALVALGLALIPSAGAAAVAALVGGWFAVVALSRLARPATREPGRGQERGRARRTLGRVVLAVALVVTVVAVGMGGSAVWAAVNSTGVPG